MRPHVRLLLPVLLVLAICAAPTAQAQRTSGAVGVGGQIGEPTGITLKFYDANSPSYDFIAAWDLDHFFFLNGHALFEQNLNADNIDQDLEWFVGPGAFIGFSDRPREDEVRLGISGTLGLTLTFNQRVELYGQFTPRIRLVPETDGDFGGGIGLRYYF